MHHRGQLMLMRADDRHRPAPDAADAGADGADAGAAAQQPQATVTAAPRFSRNAVVSARAEAQQPPRVVQRAPRRVRSARPRADDRASSSGWRSTSGRSRRISSPARSGRCTASIATSGSPRTRRRTRRTSRRSSRAAACRSTKARASTSTCRPTRSGSAAGCTRRGTPQLHAVREHIAANIRRLRAIVDVARHSSGRSARSRASGCSACRAASRRITRPPSILKYRQFLGRPRVSGGVRDQPAGSTAACSASSGSIAPLVAFLNEPLLGNVGRVW